MCYKVLVFGNITGSVNMWLSFIWMHTAQSMNGINGNSLINSFIQCIILNNKNMKRKLKRRPHCEKT